MNKILLLVALLFTSFSVMAKVHFNVSVGKDFQSPLVDHFDSVYFQSVGDPVTVEKVVVRTTSGTCELMNELRAPVRFKWGRRYSSPMWSCDMYSVIAVSIYTPTHIYTYGM